MEELQYTLKQPENYSERELFYMLKQHLSTSMLKHNVIADIHFIPNFTKYYISVGFINKSNHFLRLRYRPDKITGNYIDVLQDYASFLPTDTPISTDKHDEKFRRIPIYSVADALKYIGALSKMLDEYVYDLPAEFDCCADYIKCSDAKACVRPIETAVKCYYRKNLHKGKIFYGKNKTIDA
jgi:hypothetical protein